MQLREASAPSMVIDSVYDPARSPRVSTILASEDFDTDFDFDLDLDDDDDEESDDDEDEDELDEDEDDDDDDDDEDDLFGGDEDE